MERNQEFWEKLKQKYETKNRALLQQEQELRTKLDAMNAIVGTSSRRPPDTITTQISTHSSRAAPTEEPSTRPSATVVTQQVYVQPAAKSCECPPPQEKTGFFRSLFSVFGSNTPKPSTPPAEPATPGAPAPVSPPPANFPPAPEDAPTKEYAPPSYNIPYKNENCMCKPCEPEFPERPRPQIVELPERPRPQIAEWPERPRPQAAARTQELCDCSSCTGIERNPCPCSWVGPKGSKDPEDICNCSICSRGSAGPAIPAAPAAQDVCNCSVCSRTSKNICPCTYAALGDDNSCTCSLNEEVQIKTYSARPQPQPVPLQAFKPSPTKQDPRYFSKQPSELSLKSNDLLYMKHIHELATQHKDLLKQINDLEQKTKIYESVLSEYKNVDLSGTCPCVDTHPRPQAKAASDPDQKSHGELKLENILLKSELKDMRLDVRQYLEKMEGPMLFKIESEKYKCRQLEQKLDEAAQQMANVQDFYQKEMNALKMDLCAANSNIFTLTKANEQLNAELQGFQNKCAKLEDDLIRQKLSEAETIQSLKKVIEAQEKAGVAVKDECSLHHIARELSKILRECEPCGECMTLPEDLTTAAKLLKSLTDLVDYRINKAEEPFADIQDLGKPSDAVQGVQEKTGAPQIVEQVSKTSSSFAPVTVEVAEPEKAEQETEEPVVQTETSSNADEPQPEEKLPSFGSDVDPNYVTPQPETPAPPEEQEEQSTENIDQNAETSSKKSGESNRDSQQEEKSPSVKSDQQEKKSPSVIYADQQEKKSSSVIKSTQQAETASKKSDDSGRRDNTITYQKPKASPSLPTAQPTAQSKSKLSCRCVNFPRSSDIDELWPFVASSRTFDPMSVPAKKKCECKTSGSKKKCDCSVMKKLKEIQAQQEKFENIISTARKESQQKAVCVPSECEKLKEAQAKPPEVRETQAKPPGDGVDQLWPTTSDRFKLSHEVTASRSKDILKSETSVKCENVKENFPFDVDTQVDVINKPPDGIHVTTTVTKSGTLEVVTEGPEGVIETTLVYTKSGNIEVVTEIMQYEGKKKIGTRGGLKAIEDSGAAPVGSPDVKAIEDSGAAPIESPDLKAIEDLEPPPATIPSCGCRTCPSLIRDEAKRAAPSAQPSLTAPTPSPTPASEEEPPPFELKVDSSLERQVAEAEEPEEAIAAEDPPVLEEISGGQEIRGESNVDVNADAPEVKDEVGEEAQEVAPENVVSAPEPTEAEAALDSTEQDAVVKTLSLTLHAESAQEMTVTQTAENAEEGAEADVEDNADENAEGNVDQTGEENPEESVES